MTLPFASNRYHVAIYLLGGLASAGALMLAVRSVLHWLAP